MLKIGHILAVAIVITAFNSCSYGFMSNTASNNATSATKSSAQSSNSYGAYLAGRVAHLRKNFNTAADYYIDVLDQSSNNQELLGKVYVMLASEGRIEEAAKYARQSLARGDKNNFTHIIIAVDDIKKGNYDDANSTINKLSGPIYKDFIIPLISSWSYAGKNDYDKAVKTLSILNKEPSFRGLYYLHMAMLNDYFGKEDQAGVYFEKIVSEEHADISFRFLQLATNYYIRTDQKQKAVELAAQFNNDRLFVDMLQQLSRNIKNADPEDTKKIIDNPNKGVSEALFSIAATLRQGENGVDLAHIFISLSIYANPDYDLAKLLLADILEARGMYKEANAVYDEIPSDSEAYFTAQMKKSNNFIAAEDYKSAELLLRTLALDYPQNPQLFLDLADTLRVQGNFEEATKFYKKAIRVLPQTDNQHWILFYALAVSYDGTKNWDKAEQNFKKALELSDNHYLVANHLGYSWMTQGKNPEKAFSMIVDAYNQAPQDGNIIDSLGWAFYRLGMYDNAVQYLEKASELEPANAVIYDHLGNAYFALGRKDEAIFQWKHALTMKDKTGEMSEKEVKDKIKNGMDLPTPLGYNKKIVENKIKTIQN